MKFFNPVSLNPRTPAVKSFVLHASRISIKTPSSDNDISLTIDEILTEVAEILSFVFCSAFDGIK
ncbi:Uncharacterised protein [Streptococcus pneumoniae]|nr:Uncharacterised protein [Streptococcus pneumoniae]